MGRYIARRLVQGLAVILGVTVFVFVFTRMVGDPVKFMLPLSATDDQRDAARAALGLDRSIPRQFVDFLGDVVRLDFGQSTYARGQSALSVVFDALPRTFELIAFGMVLAIVTSVPLGWLAARRAGGPLDRVLTTLSLVALSVPHFFVGALMLIVFTVKLNLFQPGVGTWQRHLVLPAVCLAIPAVGRLSLVVRRSMTGELDTQYVKALTTKDLPSTQGPGVPTLRNFGIAYLTLVGWEIMRALAGFTIVVETVFAWPGLGFLAHEALVEQDFYLIQAIVFVVAVIVVLISIAIDVIDKFLADRVAVA